MSKSQNLMAALDQAAPAPATAAPAKPDARAQTTQGREGLANVSAYLDPQFQRNLRLLKATHDLAAQDALAEALNMLFVKYRLPVVTVEPKGRA